MNKEETLNLPDRADAAFEDVFKAVILRAKQTGTPVITWRDGKVCKLTPEEAERDASQPPNTAQKNNDQH